MKKITTSLSMMMALLFLSSFPNKANAQAFEEGKHYISLGYGYQAVGVKTIFKTFDSYAGFTVKGFGPVLAKYEYGVSDKVGIGVSLGYNTTDISWNREVEELNTETGEYETKLYKTGYKHSKLTAVARVNFHLAKDDKIDPYLGLGFGFKSNQFNLSTDDPEFSEGSLDFTGIPIAMSASFGCRFYFTENIGAFVELGMGHGFAQGGLQLKF